MFLISSIQALTIQLNKPLELNKGSGVMSGEVIINNKLQKAKAIGNYKLSSNRQSVLFTIEKIFKDDQIYKLSSHPTAIKQLKNRRIPKGSKIILAGENEEEIAKIFGMNSQNYQKVKNSTSNPTTSSNQTTGSSNQQSPSNSSSSGSGIGSSYYPTQSSNNGTNYYPVSGGSGSDNTDKSDNNYSSQYCSSPVRDGNEMNLSVVDKDGSCVEIKATRDDTKCQYRYDFNNGYAIKQTQFYYVDKENETKNIGGCVDLEGDEYRYELYSDDSKCKLQAVTDKGYGSGLSYFFQTQILFRGADGTINVAKDCSDYANVKEDLINYDVNLNNKTLKRVVNQYYIDPVSGEKVVISNGVLSPYEFKLQEYLCGAWEYNDAKLEAYRPTQIRGYDEISGTYYNATACDYSTDGGKSGKITRKYTKVIEKDVNGKAEPGDVNGERWFSIGERELASHTRYLSLNCKYGLQTWNNNIYYNSYYNGRYIDRTRWKTTYKTTNIGTTIAYERPKQDDEDKATLYYTSKTTKKIERTPIVSINEAKLSPDYMKFVEAQEGYYKDPEVLSSKEFLEWQAKYFKKNGGTYCLNYNFWNGTYKGNKPKDCEWSTGNKYKSEYSCTLRSNYLIPKD